MRTVNPDLAAVNELRREAEEVGVLEKYLPICVVMDRDGKRPSLTFRQGLIKLLKEEVNDGQHGD